MGDPGLNGAQKPAQAVPLRWRVLRSAALAVGLLALLGAGVTVFLEDKFIYFPSKEGVGAAPGEDVWLTAADGVRLHAWWRPVPGARAALLHLHGNGGNLEHRRDLVLGLSELGVSVLAIDYRGYGKSDGAPSEPGLYADARAAYDWLAARFPADGIVLHGESLGGGPACELATHVPCGGLIVQSAFTSTPDMAGLVLPWFPARWLMRTSYDNRSKVARIACRKLFMHSRGDEMIPFSHAEALFAAAAEPKERAWFDAAGHNDLSFTQGKAYYSRLAEFLSPILK